MTLNTISAFPGSRHKTQRVGRGTSSGRGHTAGRGNKGQNSRSGAKFRLGEQTTLLKQMPKRRGFTAVAHSQKSYSLVSLDMLEMLAQAGTTEINSMILVQAGLAKAKDSGVKILANGSIKTKIALSVDKCSETAREAIEKAGGSVTLLDA